MGVMIALRSLAQIYGEAEHDAKDDRRYQSGRHPADARQKMLEERRILEPVSGDSDKLRGHSERRG